MELLKNKKAVISGGSRGIGKAIAAAFLTNGAEVFLLSCDADELHATEKELAEFGSVRAKVTDVSRADDVRRAALAVKEAFGAVDILVNAAAVYGPIGLVTEADPEEWKKGIGVSLFGTFHCMHFFLPLMTNGTGTVINFGGGGEEAFPHFSSYASGKGGIVRLSETVAAEMKEIGKNVSVNTITPGPVNTKLLDDVLDAGPEKAGTKFYEQSVKQKETGGVPPEKAAALCVFLASEKVRGITGKVFSAIWDPYESFPEHKEEIMGSDVYTSRRVRPEWRGFGWGEPPKG